jgi:hypothetical protein
MLQVVGATNLMVATNVRARRFLRGGVRAPPIAVANKPISQSQEQPAEARQGLKIELTRACTGVVLRPMSR